MPIYEYKCSKCGTITEAIQKFSDAPLTDCTDCGSRGSLSKLMSLGSFHLKGSGWYVTDYGRKDTGGGASKGKGTAADKNESAGSAESKKSTDKCSDS